MDVVVHWTTSSGHTPVTAILVDRDRAQTLCVAIVGTLSATLVLQALARLV